MFELEDLPDKLPSGPIGRCRCVITPVKKEGCETMEQPEYYKSNGLSPIDAFKQGLMSEEQYKGFMIGNIIKYVVRAGKKDNAIQDLEKAKSYIDFYLELVKSNEKQEQIESEITKAIKGLNEIEEVK